MKVFRGLRFWGSAGSVVLCLVALTTLVFRWSAADGHVPIQYYLVWISFFPVISLILLFVKESPTAFRLILLKGLLFFWSGLPQPELLAVRYLLLTSLFWDASLFCSTRAMLFLLPLFTAEFLLIQYIFPGMTDNPPDLLETSTVVVCCLLLAGLVHSTRETLARLGFLENLNDKLHTSVLQLTSANTEFLERANAAGEESATDERNRITRDLHDVIGQTLTNLIMMMDAALHRSEHSPEETVKLLTWIRRQAQMGLEETRAVLYQLRELRPEGLRGIKALKKLISTFSRLSRVQTRVEWGNLPWTFEPELENAIYHMVQESLSNSFRHGSATRIEIHFHCDGDQIQVMVRDNGKGGPEFKKGIGQSGMEERIKRLGGNVEFRSETFGYVVLANLPLQEAPIHGIDQDPHRG